MTALVRVALAHREKRRGLRCRQQETIRRQGAVDGQGAERHLARVLQAVRCVQPGLVGQEGQGGVGPKAGGMDTPAIGLKSAGQIQGEPVGVGLVGPADPFRIGRADRTAQSQAEQGVDNDAERGRLRSRALRVDRQSGRRRSPAAARVIRHAVRRGKTENMDVAGGFVKPGGQRPAIATVVAGAAKNGDRALRMVGLDPLVSLIRGAQHQRAWRQCARRFGFQAAYVACKVKRRCVHGVRKGKRGAGRADRDRG